MYHHEFKIEADALTSLPEFEGTEVTLMFDMDSEHNIVDFDIMQIDGEPVSELELNFMEENEGYGPFWDRVEDACKDELFELESIWSDEFLCYGN